MTFWQTVFLAVLSGALGGAVTLIGQRFAHRNSKQLADESDARQRWWDALMWVWENRDNLPQERVSALLDALNGLSRTEEQSAMLEAVMDAALPSDDDDDQDEGGETVWASELR